MIQRVLTSINYYHNTPTRLAWSQMHSEALIVALYGLVRSARSCRCRCDLWCTSAQAAEVYSDVGGCVHNTAGGFLLRLTADATTTQTRCPLRQSSRRLVTCHVYVTRRYLRHLVTAVRPV